MKFARSSACLSLSLACSLWASSHSPTLAADKPGEDVGDAKTYLVTTLTKVEAAAKDFELNASEYAKLIDDAGGDYEKAYKKAPKHFVSLMDRMRENYKEMDSFGYETVEGIVAGVEKFAQFDVDMDAGVPGNQGPDDIAQMKLTLSNGETIDNEGALFTYIIEPALWGGDARWVKPLDLNSDGKIDPRESLPRAEVLTAAAKEAATRISKLLADAKEWTPTSADLFGAMTLMTPTLSDYFEDWKESRYSETTSGRFYAVSRVSDMTGIMKSCEVMFDAVEDDIEAKDKALANSIDKGFEDIFTFLKKISEREAKNETFTPAEIDELANQAKERTDKLVPQIEQAQALTQG